MPPTECTCRSCFSLRPFLCLWAQGLQSPKIQDPCPKAPHPDPVTLSNPELGLFEVGEVTCQLLAAVEV